MIDQRQGFLGAFGRFFFTPTDPTTLGFIRIMAGLVLLYTHAAYTTDLKAFFGPNAWWDQEAGNIQRREAPFISSPIGWGEFVPTVRIDEAPHRRSAQIDFMRKLPRDPAERRAKLEYLYMIFTGSSRDVAEGLNFANSAGRLLEDEQREQVLAALKKDVIPEEGVPIRNFPAFIHKLDVERRAVVWKAVLEFNTALPAEPEPQEFVLTWLGNYAGYKAERRIELYDFLVGEKWVGRDANGKGGENFGLPADAEEREEFLIYLNRWGTDTRQASSKGTAVFSPWYHITDGTTMWAVHGAGLVVFLLFTLGLWTRVTSVLAWAISLSYIHRGQISLFGQDTMQTILITYLMIAPCGAAFSIDALRKRYRAAKAALGSGSSVPWAERALAGPEASWLANLGIRLLQVNFCLIYLSSGISKLKGTTWWEHSAAWLVLANPEFGLVRYEAYEWCLHQISESRLAMAAVAASVTVFTLLVEIGFPFLIWTRLRPVMICLSTMLHLGIAIIMGLSMFGMAMFTLLLCYFPSKLIRDRVGYSPGMGKKMKVTYDRRSPAAVRKAALIRAMDVSHQITFVDTPHASGPNDVVTLVDPQGVSRTGHDLYTRAWQELVLLKPFAFLRFVPGVWVLVKR